MENASKALIIAGGILLALFIITVTLYMILYVRTIRQAEEAKKEIEQLHTFNQSYEVYDRKLLYGAEVISLINKIKDNNQKYQQSSTFQMNYILTDFTEDSIEKTGVYTCTNIEYNDETGRISSMSFKKYER